MSFFAPQTIKFNEMPETLVLNVLNFYVEQMKRLQDLYRKDRSNLLNYEYVDLMNFLVAENLSEFADIEPDKYKHKSLKEFSKELVQQTAFRAHFYLKGAPFDLQEELKTYLESSDPTKRYYIFDDEEFETDIIYGYELDLLLPLDNQFSLSGNIVYTTFNEADRSSHIYDIFSTCKKAEDFIINELHTLYQNKGKVIFIETDPESLKKAITQYFSDGKHETESVKLSELLANFDKQLEHL